MKNIVKIVWAKRNIKIDFVIGNPSYQDETLGDNKGYAPPVYHKFLESACEVGEVVALLFTPEPRTRCVAAGKHDSGGSTEEIAKCAKLSLEEVEKIAEELPIT